MESSFQSSSMHYSPGACEGIGIVNFFQNKSYLITGATGFLAKVFIEKMLRTVPDIGKIFLLIKAKNKEEAMGRLKCEIIDLELFKRLEEKYGKGYKTFMMNKLVPVVGNVCQSNLGMDDDLASEIANEVDVIINSAANTTFDERYDIALNTNTMGPCRLLSFAKKCKKLTLFLHFSTAYVNGERRGIILEKPISLPVLDVDVEITLAWDAMESAQENAVSQRMKELGLERARMYGWQNTYVFTKAMGEMLINSMRGDLPVAIIRPSIIESTFKEPFPGWIQGYRMLDPLILAYGKGHLPGFVGNPQTVMDVVPADTVVNATMAAMAKHGIARKPELSIYHVASSVVNPLVLDNLVKITGEYFTKTPFVDSERKIISINGLKFFNSIDSLSSNIWNEVVVQCGLTNAELSDHKLSPRLKMKFQKMVDFAINMAKIYEPYACFKGRFDNGNTRKLMKDMSREELKDFGFDVGSIDWKDYFLNVHIPGLRRHVIKERLISAI